MIWWDTLLSRSPPIIDSVSTSLTFSTSIRIFSSGNFKSSLVVKRESYWFLWFLKSDPFNGLRVIINVNLWCFGQSLRSAISLKHLLVVNLIWFLISITIEHITSSQIFFNSSLIYFFQVIKIESNFFFGVIASGL